MNRSASSARGFTLVELLIAIAVFAVMAAIAYSGLSSVIDSRDAVDAALERSKNLQMALWRIQQDVEQVVDRPIRDRFGDTQPALRGSPDIGMYLTRAGWSNPLGESRSSLQRVHYQRDGDGHLVRRYFRVLDQAQSSEPVATNLLDGVTAVEWRFLDRNGQWRDRWPPDNGGADYGASTFNPGQATPNGPGASSTRAPLPVAVELNLDTRVWGSLHLLLMIPGARL